MNPRFLVPGLTAVSGALMAIALQARGGTGYGSDAHQGKPTICVVAVKEARLLTMCPDIVEAKLAGGASWKPTGQVLVEHDPSGSDLQGLTITALRPTAEQRRLMLDDPRLRSQLAAVHVRLPIPAGQAQGAPASSLLERIPLDAGLAVTDGPTRAAIEEEMVRQKRYEVVQSVDIADYVFIAEATYVTRTTEPLFGASITVVTGSGGRKDGAEYIQAVDRTPNVRQSLLAILVPGDAYKRTPADIGALLKSRLWEGSVLMQPPYNYGYFNPINEVQYAEQRKTYADASPESLVRQLHGKEGRVNSHPVLCAASDQPFRLYDPRGSDSKPTGVLDLAQSSTRFALPSGVSFRAAVTYVPVSVAVTDAATGADIRDVAASEFHIFENDVEQKVDRVLAASLPFNLALLMDTSTSMQSKVADIQEAALRFVDAVRPDDQLMVVSFDRRIFLQASMTRDRDRLRRGLFQIDKAEGTRLYDAIRLSLDEPSFTQADRRAIVVVTDGVDTHSRLADSAATLALAGEMNVPVYAVQLDTVGAPRAARPPTVESGARVHDATTKAAATAAAADARARESAAEFLKRLTTRTGGQYYRASTLVDVFDALSNVAHDLSVQYTVCYYPSNQALDGSYRRIRIAVPLPGASVRARDGYTAGRSARSQKPSRP